MKKIHKYNLYKSFNTVVWESEGGETTFKTSENVALVVIMGPSKVTRKAPDVVLDYIRIEGRVTHI